MQILIHHHSTDRHSVSCTETAILHINCDCNLRVVHRSKSHKYGVVLTAVLCRTGFSACLHARQNSPHHAASCTACASGNSSAHTLRNLVVVFPINRSYTRSAVDAIQLMILYLLDNMWSNKMSPVGNGRSQIGNLQWSGKDFALPDRDTDDSQPIPRTPVCFIIEFCIRN